MQTRKVTLLVLPALLLCILLTDCGGSSGTPTLTTIAVTSAQSSIAVSGTDSFSATAKDQNGNVMSGVIFAWSSSAASVATINASSGVAMGLLPGMTQVTASANGVTSNPATLTVTPGFLATGSMSQARSDATATLLNNGMVLIAGGQTSEAYLSEAELYNPATGTFAVTGGMNTARSLHIATLLNNGMVLIAGGYNSSGFLGSAELYNPASGTFTVTGSMNTARRFFPMIVLQDGTVLIAGGADATDPLQALASAEIYDPVAGTFTPTGSMNVERRLTSGTLLENGMVLIAGGINIDETLGSAELYNPATGTFTFTGNLNSERFYHTATLLNNGMVLIAGGEAPSGSSYVPLASAELYDPANGTFAATGSLNAARVGPTATLLNNGSVLSTGGVVFSGATDVPLFSAEVYDPVAGTFATTGSLNRARATQTATLLPNGTVLVVGGFDADGSLASAEFYELGTLTPARRFAGLPWAGSQK
jgi:Galactose oxidase, central domain